ncbi:MAG: protein-glutamate O-methyltransferase [Candidatus Eisenbacteria bacterium]|uniref:protein-glutamate O-methyltransferase n=1 Tax=Eiseniibacteriota bacterium TaxID=2212470 RepID=A0A937X720_UNCEI|nr:protein-glutamate O-methyltransferase [Candidatus Eisenbacteria bacterium]
MPATACDRLTPRELRRLREIVRRLSGIDLPPHKEPLVRARLRKRLRELGLSDFGGYLRLLSGSGAGAERQLLIEALATRLTGFYREPDHFRFLSEEAVAEWCARGGPTRLRLWSAGCATGEEAYSLALALHTALPRPQRWDLRILATDLSTRALVAGRRGVYAAEQLAGLPDSLRGSYFRPLAGDPPAAWRVAPELRRLVSFARLNLIEPWPMRGPFEAIFCRNVMIYFDPPTQRGLVQRFGALLRPGGLLFLGHSESLTGGLSGFRFVRPSVYRRS